MSETDQFLLELPEDDVPSLENFIVGENAHVVAVLRDIAQNRGPQFVYLYGPEGAGVTHLLRAVVPDAGRRAPAYRSDRRIYAVDDIDRLDDEDLSQLTSLMNDVARDPQAHLLCGGRLAPARLSLGADVKSRLLSGLTLAVAPLGAADRARVLSRQAALRGIALSADILQWMTAHLSNDMRTLTRVLNMIDYLSLKDRRQVTLPLVRQAAEAIERDALIESRARGRRF